MRRVRGRVRRRAGFSLLSAIFLLVVLGAAGALMVNLTGVQRRTTTFALMGARAYYAARSGIDWGVHQTLGAGSCPADTSFGLTQGGLGGFDVSVTCTSSGHTEAGTDSSVYQIAAVAEYGSYGDRDYVRRRLQVTLTDAP